MTGRSLGVALAALAWATVGQAQRTWVVDGAGGPGADFADVPPAIAAAAPGDTLRVLAWNGI